MIYLVSSAGYNVALVSLAVVVPQCRSTGVQSTRRNYAADGGVFDEARYVELIFDLVPNVTAFQALLTQFGVINVLTCPVTIYAPDERYSPTRMNGIAVRPEVGKDQASRNYFIRGVTILVKNLAASA